MNWIAIGLTLWIGFIAAWAARPRGDMQMLFYGWAASLPIGLYFIVQ